MDQPQIIPFAQAAQFFLGKGQSLPVTNQASAPQIIPFDQAMNFFLGHQLHPAANPQPRAESPMPPTAPPDKNGLVNAIAQAGAQAFGPDEVPALMEIIKRESGFNPQAQNSHSTAYGLFQFLDGTWQGTGIPKTSDPNAQIAAGLKYIGNRYQTPSKALQFHNKKGWY